MGFSRKANDVRPYCDRIELYRGSHRLALIRMAMLSIRIGSCPPLFPSAPRMRAGQSIHRIESNSSMSQRCASAATNGVASRDLGPMATVNRVVGELLSAARRTGVVCLFFFQVVPSFFCVTEFWTLQNTTSEFFLFAPAFVISRPSFTEFYRVLLGCTGYYSRWN